jgi:hypothetical protein
VKFDAVSGEVLAEQAGLLAEGRIDEFEALTARLKGGREVE